LETPFLKKNEGGLMMNIIEKKIYADGTIGEYLEKFKKKGRR
jgi:hypothetical protein